MNFKKLLLGALVAVAFTSCEKDDPEDIHEHEVFSNVRLTLTSEEGDEVEFHWHDKDEDLEVELDEYENGSLAPNTTYTAVVSFDEEEEHDDEEDEDEDGHDHKVAEDDDHDHDEHESLDEEISEEAEEHQIFYSTVAGLTITYTDKDADGNPLGVKTTFTTDNSYNGGSLTVTLRHEPNKSADNVSEGDITYAGGETDVEVTFTLGVDNSKLSLLEKE